MLKILAFTAVASLGAAGLLRRLVFALVVGCVVSRTIRALVVGAAVAVVAARAYTGG